jgi:hypothetical protein
MIKLSIALAVTAIVANACLPRRSFWQTTGAPIVRQCDDEVMDGTFTMRPTRADQDQGYTSTWYYQYRQWWGWQTSNTNRRDGAYKVYEKIDPDFTVYFKIKPDNNGGSGSYRNILRVSGRQGDCCSYGSRLFAVWQTPGNNALMHISAGDQSNGNRNWNTDMELKLGEYTTVTFTAYGNQAFLAFQDEQENMYYYKRFSGLGTRRQWSYPNVFISDPYYPAASARLKGAVIENLDCSNQILNGIIPEHNIDVCQNEIVRHEEPLTLEQGRLYAQLTKLDKDFTVQFDIKPDQTLSECEGDWCNVMRIENVGGSCCSYGQRLVGVWHHINCPGMLHVVVGDTQSPSNSMNIGDGFCDANKYIPTDEWTTVIISAQGDEIKTTYQYADVTDHANYGKVWHTQQMQVEDFYRQVNYDANVWLSDSYHTAAPDQIKNFVVSNNDCELAEEVTITVPTELDVQENFEANAWCDNYIDESGGNTQSSPVSQEQWYAGYGTGGGGLDATTATDSHDGDVLLCERVWRVNNDGSMDMCCTPEYRAAFIRGCEPFDYAQSPQTCDNYASGTYGDGQVSTYQEGSANEGYGENYYNAPCSGLDSSEVSTYYVTYTAMDESENIADPVHVTYVFGCDDDCENTKIAVPAVDDGTWGYKPEISQYTKQLDQCSYFDIGSSMEVLDCVAGQKESAMAIEYFSDKSYAPTKGDNLGTESLQSQVWCNGNGQAVSDINTENEGVYCVTYSYTNECGCSSTSETVVYYVVDIDCPEITHTAESETLECGESQHSTCSAIDSGDCGNRGITGGCSCGDVDRNQECTPGDYSFSCQAYDDVWTGGCGDWSQTFDVKVVDTTPPYWDGDGCTARDLTYCVGDLHACASDSDPTLFDFLKPTPNDQCDCGGDEVVLSRDVGVDYTYRGCYNDGGDRDLKLDGQVEALWGNQHMTADLCFEHCLSKGAQYFSTQYAGECFCGDSFGSYGDGEGCNMACTGDSTEMCGGSWHNSVYQITSGSGVWTGAYESRDFTDNYINQWLVSSLGDLQYHDATYCGVNRNDAVDAAVAAGSDDLTWESYLYNGLSTTGCGNSCNNGYGLDFGSHYYGSCNPTYIDGGDAYATTYLIAEEAKSVELQLGSDDGILVWLNGEEVWANVGACRCYADNQERITINLVKGANRLVIKIGENGGHFGLVAALSSTAGISMSIEKLLGTDSQSTDLWGDLQDCDTGACLQSDGTFQNTGSFYVNFVGTDAIGRRTDDDCSGADVNCDDGYERGECVERITVVDCDCPYIELVDTDSGCDCSGNVCRCEACVDTYVEPGTEACDNYDADPEKSYVVYRETDGVGCDDFGGYHMTASGEQKCGYDSLDDASEDQTRPGSYIVVYDVCDDSGNCASTCSSGDASITRTIIIEDTTTPVVECNFGNGDVIMAEASEEIEDLNADGNFGVDVECYIATEAGTCICADGATPSGSYAVEAVPFSQTTSLLGGKFYTTSEYWNAQYEQLEADEFVYYCGEFGGNKAVQAATMAVSAQNMNMLASECAAYKVTYSVTDCAGRTGSAYGYVWTVDTINPDITGAGFAAVSSMSPVTATGFGAMALAGVAIVVAAVVKYQRRNYSQIPI